MEFAAASVAAGLSLEAGTIGEVCEQIAAPGPVYRGAGAGGSGQTEPVSGRYGFSPCALSGGSIQADHTSATVRLHRKIGARLETGYQECIAKRLPRSWPSTLRRGRDYPQQYSICAGGENALRRHANHEAITHLSKGMELAPALPGTPKRTNRNSPANRPGHVVMATKGYAAPEVERAYLRAHELCEQVGGTSQLFQVLRGLVIFYTVRANFQTARKLGNIPQPGSAGARPSLPSSCPTCCWDRPALGWGI